MRFTKMHGSGNDFIVIDATNTPVTLSKEAYRQIADRRYGIGCDQILLVESSLNNDADFGYRIINADGSEVEQCGNGARCFAKYVRDKQLTDKRSIKVQTLSGIITLNVLDDERIEVNMGAPIFEAHLIPIDKAHTQINGQHYCLPITSTEGIDQWQFNCLSMGNPHAVIHLEQQTHDTGPLAHLNISVVAQAMQQHPMFPNSVNVGFMSIDDRHHAHLRVYERGSGETLACGTGACAAAVSAIRQGLLDSPCEIKVLGGTLTIAWSGDAQSVIMTGDAVSVFEGIIHLDTNK